MKERCVTWFHCRVAKASLLCPVFSLYPWEIHDVFISSVQPFEHINLFRYLAGWAGGRHGG